MATHTSDRKQLFSSKLFRNRLATTARATEGEGTACRFGASAVPIVAEEEK
jgi:hypothetical protein